MAAAYLGLGSNLGDRAANIRKALREISENSKIRLKRVSSLYETAPVGVINQPDFVNAVACVETDLSPLELLHSLLEIEKNLGRVRNLRWGPRVIDIDLLLYDRVEMDTDELTIPHPRMTERAFVMRPLAEIAPNLQIRGESVIEIAQELSDQHVSRMSEVT